METCLIIRYQLGPRTWFLVETPRMILSTPFDSEREALTWIADVTRCSISSQRITDDCRQVTVLGGAS